ncbi:succinylglutamate desuccinylase/aspartoacylase family protein [Bradyrhizobium sp. HKCCYLS20291]|uniref:succinylglutamate desuccinylase/aspartoacylase family protein n=1 Tax=Bradyrhizobium sp. HKCCYLS20291 TaxID=3420766 RepID=UPI003EB81FFA
MSRISPTISFDAPGKHAGFLRLPHSTHESAYGWIPIPIVCVVGSPGPTVLLIAGNHGDEYEGQVALAELCRALDPADLQGRVIILPAANFPAAMAGRRVSPIDGGNLNRSFPGSEGGSPTEMIADFIETKLLPLSDCVIDLHSGGSSLQYCPTIRARSNPDPGIMERTLTLLRAFGAPYGCIFKPLSGENRTMAAAAARSNVPYLCVEIGGGGSIQQDYLALTNAGVNRILAVSGIAKGEADPPGKTEILSVNGFDNYVYAPENGLFQPLAELGDVVMAGQLAARMHFPDTPWREPAAATFQTAGRVLCRRFPSLTKRGDCLYEIGVGA